MIITDSVTVTAEIVAFRKDIKGTQIKMIEKTLIKCIPTTDNDIMGIIFLSFSSRQNNYCDKCVLLNKVEILLSVLFIKRLNRLHIKYLLSANLSRSNHESMGFILLPLISVCFLD